jgi:hypothetical protein
MSYRDPEKGYKGLNYAAAGGAVLLMFAARAFSNGFDLPKGHVSPDQVAAKMLADNDSGQLYGTLKQTYPDDFNTLVTQITNYQEAGESDAGIAASIRAFLAATVRRHNGDLAQAPSNELAAFRGAEIMVVNDLRSTDVRQCARYIAQGAIDSDTARALTQELQQRAFEAASAGRDKPAGREVGQPAAATMRIVTRNMASQGVTPSQIAALLAPKPGQEMAPTDQCLAGLAFLHAIDDLPDREADQLSAYRLSGT